MSHDQWIERHRRAWGTADEDEVADLFTPEASYRSSVFREPYLGGEAIGQDGRPRNSSARRGGAQASQPSVTASRSACAETSRSWMRTAE